MSLSLTITRLLPVFPNKVFFQWDLLDPTESGTYLFNVYRSGGPEGPWETLVTAAPNIFNYMDVLATAASAGLTLPNLLSKTRNVYYKVEAVPPSGIVNMVTAVSNIEPRLEGVQKQLKRKILFDEAIVLKRLNGTEVAVLKRMRWGTRCTRCTDKYTKESMRGHCTLCMGVGFQPGYFTPVLTLAKRGVMTANTVLTAQSKTDTGMTQLMLLDVPRVDVDDIVVFLRDNRRYLVKQAANTELQTVTVHQELSCSELARTSIEYKVIVDPTRIPSLF